jgi:hypothetical protein
MSRTKMWVWRRNHASKSPGSNVHREVYFLVALSVLLMAISCFLWTRECAAPPNLPPPPITVSHDSVVYLLNTTGVYGINDTTRPSTRRDLWCMRSLLLLHRPSPLDKAISATSINSTTWMVVTHDGLEYVMASRVCDQIVDSVHGERWQGVPEVTTLEKIGWLVLFVLFGAAVLSAMSLPAIFVFTGIAFVFDLIAAWVERRRRA